MAAPLRLSCVLLAALAALQPSSAQNFCNISSCRSPSQHTMCRFTSSRVSRACGAVRVSSVSAADRAEILRVHNDLRRAVQRGAHRNRGLPAARYMPNLRWSSSLARIAQRWANQCQTGHDQCRNLPGKYVGQNFAWSGNQAKDWRNRIANAWFSSELPYVRSTLSNLKYRGGKAGHLTQIIWAKTTEIGCGYVETKRPRGRYVERFYFCNYGPGGNYYGQRVYDPK
ncbi:venom allergen 5-like [Amphibalanus amphitrite]|uniref:venom allergen 5-like n=1 Tax=Amphibalanus amphitrite TaxID=1232801 RepID=UPI001C90FC13|nr:venom allergen 5-like [Amphibalanus amphitrite]